MADFANCSTPDLIQRATALFTGLRDDPDALAALADYEVELDDEVKRGLDLLGEVQTAIGRQAAEHGEAVTATGAAAVALALLEAFYVRHRKLARARHKRGTAGYSALGLVGDVPDRDAELIAEADAFYRALQASPDLAAGVRGLSAKAVAEGLARVEAARAAEAAQARESGESQRATSVRQDAEARLRALSADVAVAVEDAFADEPQRRETLGLFERGNS